VTDDIFTRMGDGERISMAAKAVKEDLRLGTEDAAKVGKIPELNNEELDQLFEIFAEPGRTVSVPSGSELIGTDDGVGEALPASEADGGAGIPMSRLSSILAYERAVAADTASMGHEDYSFKPVKAIIDYETQSYFDVSQSTTVPLFYGAQPNLGLYYQPDGPFPNPADLFPHGKIAEAKKSQEDAAEQLEKDMVFVGKRLYEAGCEGLNFDTAASAGDPDFYATLKAAAVLKKDCPTMALIVGMASEFVLGMHGGMEFAGKKLAGLFPHEQVKIAEEAGVDIFGPAVNVNTTETTPWNLARAVTFIKETVNRADIPVHPNVGMGVCGVPMILTTPVDCVSRVSKALALIGKADGL
jgi:dimethylamine---corrinoid protein Co-methyltransferase